MMYSIDEIVSKIKQENKTKDIGMILIHNGIVRRSSKDGKKSVNAMNISYDRALLSQKITELKSTQGIVEALAFINEGKLNVGDDIMLVVVAGDRRSNVLKPFEEFIEYIKKYVVREDEV